MEQPIQTECAVSPALRSQLRECFGRVAYSHKTHEKAADYCLAVLRRIKLWQISLSAFTTGGLIVTILGAASVSRVSAIFSAVVSAVLLTLNAYSKDFDPGQSAQKHKDAADKLWNLRESYLSLLTDVEDGRLSANEIRARRDELQERLAAAYAGAPRTSARAYARAGEGLKKQEELSFSDDEIDQFLPVPLRSNRTR